MAFAPSGLPEDKNGKAAPLLPEKRPWFILSELNPFYFELLGAQVEYNSRRVAEAVLVIR